MPQHKAERHVTVYMTNVVVLRMLHGMRQVESANVIPIIKSAVLRAS